MEVGTGQCNLTEQRNVINEPEFILTTFVLGIINVSVVFGNSLVIAAVFTSRKLRTVTNMFIVSLAVADLLLGVVILPFSIAYEVLDYWIFGGFMCTVWLAVDVWLSTASILNLCAISLDRYLAITEPIKYPNLMCPKRARILIASVWVLAFVICLPPLLGWNDPGSHANDSQFSNISDSYLLELLSYSDWNFTESSTYLPMPVEPTKSCVSEILPLCELVSERGYRIYSALGSFYIPMFVMLYFYLRIYLAAVRTAASLRKGVLTTKKSDDHQSKEEGAVTLRVHRGATSRHNARYECSVKFSNKNGTKQNGQQLTHCREVALVQSAKKKTERDGLLHPGKERRKRRHRSSQESNHSSETEMCSARDLSYSRKSGQDRSGRLRVPRENWENHENGKRNSLRVEDEDSLDSGHRSHFTLKGAGKKNLKHARKFKRETKAAKTLAIIVGAFILCWLPFFSVYLIGAFCETCITPILFSILFWLGYCNSAINPCVYALFSRDFRHAFKRLLWCGSKKPELKSRFQSYGPGAQLQFQMKDSESLSES